ncbi:hypothetical protein CKK34_5966 [Yarrowia sp. E02]|nr:hypothetical protein CKK34_5966 [Yarrowia sp. E02]
MKFARIALVSLAALAAAQDKKADGQNPISSPGANTKISPGENFYITWVADPAIQAITLSLIKDGQKVLDIAPGQANDGKFTWPVPFDLEAGSDYSIEITTFNGDNVNYSPDFTITDRDESVQNQIQNPNAHGLVASASGATEAAPSAYTWSDEVNTNTSGVFASTTGSADKSASTGSADKSGSASADKSGSATGSASESKATGSSEGSSTEESSASATGESSGSASGSATGEASASGSASGSGASSGSNGSGSASATGSGSAAASSAGSSATSAAASASASENANNAGSLKASVALVLAAGVAAQLL